MDEAFLDVTENKKGMELGVQIAREIKKRIFETTGLTASAGVSYCKFLAFFFSLPMACSRLSVGSMIL